MDKNLSLKVIMGLSPLFLILCLAVLLRSTTYSDSLIADESMFIEHALNLTHGYFTDKNDPNLMEGPGYPIYLAIFEVFDAPFALTRSTNILLLFVAYVYLFLALQRYIGRRPALILTYCFGLYPPLLRWANLMYSEPLMLLLLLGFCYHFIMWYNKNGKYKSHFYIAIFYLGYLSLTKLIFPYVILVALLVALAFMLFPKITRTFQLKGTVIILLGALFILSPYVVYTYSITEKFFYLGMRGGNILYFRSTPFENEFGNSYADHHILQDKPPTGREEVMANTDQLRKNHGEFFKSTQNLSRIQRDSAFTAKALENMKTHPSKYVKNTIANVSRIFFHFPFSYRIQNLDTLGYLIPNIFILVLAVLGVYPAYMRRNRIPKELIILLLVSLIYLGGHTLLGGRGRFLIPVVPIWILFFSFIYFRILQIKFRDDSSLT